MSDIQWSNTKDKYIILFDKAAFDKAEFLEVLQWLRARFLVRKAAFNEEVEVVGEEILAEWWEKNKERFIPTTGL